MAKLPALPSFFLLPIGILLLGISAAAQTGQIASAISQNPAATAATSQQETAAAAMEKSLQQQQASLDNFRDNLQSGSIAQQLQSIRKQSGIVDPPSAESASASTSASDRKEDIAAVTPVEMHKKSDFFTVPWPPSIPLAIPNVQVADVSCDVLGKSDVDELVESASQKNGISPDLLRSVMRQESGFRPCALSVAGAMGLMQIMPDTADMLGLDDPYNPAKNVDAGAKFLKMMLDRYKGDLPMALGAYNAGPGKVDKAGGIPPIAETVQYVTNVLGDLPEAY